MFGKSKEEMAKMQAEHDAHRMLSKMLSQAILNSDNASESMKICVLAMDKSEEVQEAIHDLVKNYVDPDKKANAETLKKVFEYLQFVEVGIKQFIAATPLVVEETEED